MGLCLSFLFKEGSLSTTWSEFPWHRLAFLHLVLTILCIFVFFPLYLAHVGFRELSGALPTYLVSGLINTLKSVAVSEWSRRYIVFNIAPRASWFTVFRLELSCKIFFFLFSFLEERRLFFWNYNIIFPLQGLILDFSAATFIPIKALNYFLYQQHC